jgi:alcohol dehydrogenase
VEDAGSAVTRFKRGDKVLINCISSCATCKYCRRGMPSHCVNAGWILGHTTDGTQAQYIRVPFADSGLHHVPDGVNEKHLVMLSDIMPTGLECGVMNGKVQPGCTVAIVGAGPVGLAALLTSKLYSPSLVIVIDRDPSRLKVAKKLGAHHVIDSSKESTAEVIMKLTDDTGCDTVMEAVGVPETLEMCQDLVAPGGVIANIGVHGGPCSLKIEKLWGANISLTTRLVDTVTTPMLLKLFAAGEIKPGELITHEVAFKDMEGAYDMFKAAAKHNALKMLITM